MKCYRLIVSTNVSSSEGVTTAVHIEGGLLSHLVPPESSSLRYQTIDQFIDEMAFMDIAADIEKMNNMHSYRA